jgi:two-component sensor histidine kinase
MKNKQTAINAIESIRTNKIISVARFWIDNQNRVKSINQLCESLEMTEQAALNLTGYLSNNYGFIFHKIGAGKKSEYKLLDCNFGNEPFAMPEISKLMRIALGLNPTPELH